VILHLPLESHRDDVTEEKGTINSRMTDEEILAMLAHDIGGVPGLSGVSNHMGSRATEDRRVMTVILRYLKKHNLYFLDSLTSGKSVCGQVASTLGARFAKRNIFLDNSNDEQYIENQVLSMRKLALRKGRVVALCHDRKNTVAVLGRMMPELERDGIEFVYLSELVS